MLSAGLTARAARPSHGTIGRAEGLAFSGCSGADAGGASSAWRGNAERKTAAKMVWKSFMGNRNVGAGRLGPLWIEAMLVFGQVSNDVSVVIAMC